MRRRRVPHRRSFGPTHAVLTRAVNLKGQGWGPLAGGSREATLVGQEGGRTESDPESCTRSRGTILVGSQPPDTITVRFRSLDTPYTSVSSPLETTVKGDKVHSSFTNLVVNQWSYEDRPRPLSRKVGSERIVSGKEYNPL